MHMMNKLKFLTGTPSPGKTSAKRSNARPLLVVHSGNNTSGRSAVLHNSSRLDKFALGGEPYGGTRAVETSTESNDTRRNPRTGLRGIGALAADDNAADPVPVLRPGVLRFDCGDKGAECGGDRVTVSQTGRTKIGSNLKQSMDLIRMTQEVQGRFYRGAYRKASQRISIHDTQLDTMTAPAPGFQHSEEPGPRLMATSLNHAR
jgi:hypothetical protein